MQTASADPAATDTVAAWEALVAGVVGAERRDDGLSPEGLDLDGAVAALQAVQRLKSWADAQTARLTERIRVLAGERLSARGLRPGSLGDTLAAAEIACAMRVPERTAHLLVQHSNLLTQRYDATMTALESGRITWRHAVTVVEESSGIPNAAAVAFQEQLVPIAEDTTVPKLAYRARRLRSIVHPESLAERTRNAFRNRRVELSPDHDGMAWLHVYLSAERAVAVNDRLTAMARGLQCPEESRNLAQLRADVFTDLLTHSCEAGGNSRSAALHGVQAHVNVTVPVLTLLGVDDAPADLEGYGPISADIAQMLAAHAPSFTRLLTHPETGAVLSVGRNSYAVPADLKKWLRVRDRTCRHPGCNRSAASTELDHTVPWSRAGTTAHNNLSNLCRRHHMLKSEGLWHYAQPEPGVIQATSLAGKSYTTLPEPVPA